MSPIHGHLTDVEAQRLAEGAPRDPGAAEAERHAASCVRCRAEVEAYRMLSAALDDLAAPPLPADFTDGVLARVEAQERAATRERRHAVAIFSAAVVAAAVTFAIAGAAAWAPVVSSLADRVGRGVHALQIGWSFLPTVVGALRFQILFAVAALALPLVYALVRLMPAPQAERI
jgi:anti-sigma factor RsiW